MPFCPVCGVTILKSQTFCDAHRPMRLDIKEFEIKYCLCGRMLSHNRWITPETLEPSVLRVVKDNVRQPATIRMETLVLPEKRGKTGQCLAIAAFEGEEYQVPFTIRHEQCDKCARLGSHYFTAKLQLRDPPKGVMEYINEYLAPLAEKGVAVNKMEDTPRGPDLFMTHKATARQLGEKLVRKYGGSMRMSEQLFSKSKETSKDLFRLNVVVEFALFKKGDVVLYKGNPVIVTGLGKQCTGRHLTKDSKAVFSAKESEGVLEQQSATVITTRPRVEIIHPLTFQQTSVSNPDERLAHLQEGEKVKVVVQDKRIFIVA